MFLLFAAVLTGLPQSTPADGLFTGFDGLAKDLAAQPDLGNSFALADKSKLENSGRERRSDNADTAAPRKTGRNDGPQRRTDSAGSERANRRQSPAAQRIPADVAVHRDIEYVENGHERHRLDLYLPKRGDASRPLIVFIHGGGWRQGNKNGAILIPLMQRGYACAAINYRLSHHAVFPAQIEDCKAAIRWLRAHSSEYGYNGRKIGVWGTSAGGHLVALLGTSGDVADFETVGEFNNVSSRVQAVCDFFGPTNFLTMDAQAGGRGKFLHSAADSPESKLIGGPIQDRPDETRRASPLEYVSADDPPFYIVHGDADPLVPVEQSRSLKAALDRVGVSATLRVVEGAGHGRFRDPAIGDSVVEFFGRTLGDVDGVPD